MKKAKKSKSSTQKTSTIKRAEAKIMLEPILEIINPGNIIWLRGGSQPLTIVATLDDSAAKKPRTIRITAGWFTVDCLWHEITLPAACFTLEYSPSDGWLEALRSNHRWGTEKELAK